MNAVQLLGVAGSLSLLAGWRLYATVLATGLAMRFGLLHLPEQVRTLDVLANPWVMGAAGLGALAELFADKIAWVDSLWDGIHTVIRPLGGALLALAVVDARDPAWQVATFLLGGGAALLSHTAKAGARAVINTSPEPVSNIAASTGGDIFTVGSLWLVLTHPAVAIVVAVVVLAIVAAMLFVSWRVLRHAGRLLRRRPSES
jgi:hypothetical protein